MQTRFCLKYHRFLVSICVAVWNKLFDLFFQPYPSHFIWLRQFIIFILVTFTTYHFFTLTPGFELICSTTSFHHRLLVCCFRALSDYFCYLLHLPIYFSCIFVNFCFGFIQCNDTDSYWSVNEPGLNVCVVSYRVRVTELCRHLTHVFWSIFVVF